MNIVLLDIFCVVVAALGLALLLKRPARRGGAAITPADRNPQTYILRIAGVMLIAFGLALGLMTTLFHFS